MSLHRLVIDTAVAHPDRLAVACGEDALTYRELDRAADAFAHRLGALGVRRGDRVVLWSAKSVDVVVAMQAVLRLGAAYVPLDRSSPARRVATIAADCEAVVVCADRGRLHDVRALLGEVPVVELPDSSTMDAAPPAPVCAPVDEDELAYVLYTSGSTGAPKGVCISHRNALAFVRWAADELRVRPSDRLANHAPLAFDLSVLDLYAAFAAGASVHLLPTELAYAPELLVRFLRDERITIWYSVPSALVLMIRDGGLLDEPAPESLRVICFAGEPFGIAGVRALRGWTSARLLNLYGPTETNVCTFHEVTPADLARDRPVPIGTACSGDTVWAQRPDGTVAGPGEEGELVADGPTVMRGYWGRPPHRGPYHTGDIVRVRDDGSFDYVGRRDHTVKVRGHRIGLGEVETAIAGHPDVEQVVVVVAGTGIDARLVGYAVAAPGRAPSQLALKARCAEVLPTYAVVDQVHFVPDLPRTGNGKVDRSAVARWHPDPVPVGSASRGVPAATPTSQERRPG